MRIAFYVIGNSRRSGKLNGDNIRYNGASASGTDTSTILVAEQLALKGHEVVYACENAELGDLNRGVLYTDLDFNNVTNKKFDILISMLWVDDYERIPIEVTKAIVYWSHMQWAYSIDKIKNFAEDRNINVGVVHVSEWEKSMTQDAFNIFQDFDNSFHQQVIYNPLPTDIINEVKYDIKEKLPHKSTFHASFPRGGRVTYDIMKSLNWDDGELHVFDYLMNININWGRKEEDVEIDDTLLHIHGGSDKKEIFTHLAESEYFIYVPSTPYDDIHKDTFSCVVAEALAMGCIVITYPLGALPECFPECCVWLDIPEDEDIEKIQSEPLTKDYERKFEDVNQVLKKVQFLENNESYKNNIREYAKTYVIKNYNISKIGNEWEDFLTTLI